MCNTVSWGLTLLERNLRVLEKLGIKTVVLLTPPDVEPHAHFRHPLPKELSIRTHRATQDDPWRSLRNTLAAQESAILVLEGNSINDPRILSLLMRAGDPCAVISPNGTHPAGAGVLSAKEARLFKKKSNSTLTEVLRTNLHTARLRRLELGDFDSYMKNLRRHISPFLILVENKEQMQNADHYLKQTVHKGTNDLVAKTIHPPLEFGLTRLLASTPVTPNLVTGVGILLSACTVYLFASGNLLTGILLAAVKGVLDGVDGKLARLLLKYSKAGDLLDHVGDTVFDALWYLALGWHFSQGEVTSPAAVMTWILFGAYWVERIVPGIFKKLHGYEIYDYAKVDRFMRLIGSRMNNNVWVLMIGILSGFARETFYFVSLWMLATAGWHSFRLVYVTLRSARQD
ncbi:MAG: CDP-alcohol phosphatidyltransferase family protein [bacterium]